MTRHERLILRYSKKIGSDNIITTQQLLDAGIPMDARELRACVQYMKSTGLIDILSVDLDGDATFHLSFLGQHPHELSWIQFRNFMIRSVLVPIVVSAATTWVLSVISGM